MAAKLWKLSAAMLAGGLLLSSCTAPETGADMPDDLTHQKATEQPAQPSSPSTAPSQSAEEMTRAQFIASTGSVIAATLGFPNSRQISAEELKVLAVPPADTLKDVVVLPSQCSKPVEDLNWSPAQMGTEAARTDFTNEAQNIAGSIEVAKVTNRQKLEDHYKTVLEMRTECENVKLNGLEFTETLKFSSPGISGVESQLYYTRTGDSANARESLVLMQSKGDYVVMVSFMSTVSLAEQQFKDVAKTILDTAVSQL
ncbi:hypothetical protein [Glutamicibacter ardleyensis]|uniref:Sensor domain-containing protein n=1 Tax=Glutamicibacter ardleyensis TaxID=225894 RepID=A0ABQ2D4E8_9MICC|nr:hypothetical protein [Glutamicibacter ardleyensis]GGJ45830.1 hypothetical protein GCM10007173_00340 [Glutamicibacter ardleyensis]